MKITAGQKTKMFNIGCIISQQSYTITEAVELVKASFGFSDSDLLDILLNDIQEKKLKTLEDQKLRKIIQSGQCPECGSKLETRTIVIDALFSFGTSQKRWYCPNQHKGCRFPDMAMYLK